MKWNILWITVLLSVSTESYAGGPDWIRETSKGIEFVPPEGKCFEYFIGNGENKTRAVKDALGEIAMSHSVQISAEVREILREKSGKVYEEIVSNIDAKGESPLIEGLKVKEVYLRKDINQYWVLVRVPKVMNWQNCEEGVKDSTAHIRRSAAWRSALIPGWGQSYKGEKRKGLLMRRAEGISAGVALCSYLMYWYEEDKISSSRRRTRSTVADICKGIAMVTGALSGLIHAYNVWDAIAAPGAKIYAEVHSGEDGRLTFSVGRGLTINYVLDF